MANKYYEIDQIGNTYEVKAYLRYESRIIPFCEGTYKTLEEAEKRKQELISKYEKS
jgi:hypothetical protein